MRYDLLDRIKETQKNDQMVQKWVEKVQKREISNFNVSSKGILKFRSEERRVGKSVDLGGRRIIKKKKKRKKHISKEQKAT